MAAERLTAIYHVTSDAAAIERHATGIAVEQSVEMPVAAIDDPQILSDIVGRVETITELAPGRYEVRIGLATATTGADVCQLINMLFGNSSIHPHITFERVVWPPGLAERFGGPRHGLAGLRRRVGVAEGAMTCSALKPQGLAPPALARLAARMAEGGLDMIKDDHSLADQAYSPFAERVRQCADAVAETNARTGGRTAYLPNLSGDLDQLRRQRDQARAAGVDAVLIAPMLVGLPAFHTLVAESPDVAFMAHPSFTGAQRLAPPLLLGTLFRVFGADATVFTNYGGRFGFSPELCRAIANAALEPWPGIAPCAPVPAGGMTLARVPELLDFYGPDTILLIGGDLLSAGDRLVEVGQAFAATVRGHRYATPVPAAAAGL